MVEQILNIEQQESSCSAVHAVTVTVSSMVTARPRRWLEGIAYSLDYLLCENRIISVFAVFTEKPPVRQQFSKICHAIFRLLSQITDMFAYLHVIHTGRYVHKGMETNLYVHIGMQTGVHRGL